MFDGAPIAWWIGFHVVVLMLILVDLLVLGRGEASNQNRHNFLFVLFLLILAAGFGVWIGHDEGRQRGLEFAAGYLIELSMSIDNLFVFLLMFRSFGLSGEAQRKALLLGIVGAIVMRGLFIFAGIALLERFAWIQYVFGALLVIAAVRLLPGKKHESTPPAANWITQWAERLSGGRANTSRATFLLAVVAIELVDLVFAIDSVPAVLAISHHPFVVYTSNICAILGLRALYFLLAGLLERLRFLHFGLAAILGFVGLKMMLAKLVSVPVAYSLGFIVLVIAAATGASLIFKGQDSHA
ncbi:MAG: TerC/Alx family metal homeostasis membrane protein [Acidobacteriaceae bacterium]